MKVDSGKFLTLKKPRPGLFLLLCFLFTSHQNSGDDDAEQGQDAHADHDQVAHAAYLFGRVGQRGLVRVDGFFIGRG